MATSTDQIPSGASFIISNITTLVRVTLDSDNFFVWVKLLRNALIAGNLLGYLDGSYLCSSCAITGPVVDGRTLSLPNLP